jgi:hypothetical protein
VLDAGIALDEIQSAVDRGSDDRDAPAESARRRQGEGCSLSNHAVQHGDHLPQMLTNQDHEADREMSAAQPQGQQTVAARDDLIGSGSGGSTLDAARMLANRLHEQFKLLWAEVTRFNTTFGSKPCVIIVNKADLYEGSARNAFGAAVSRLKALLAEEAQLPDCSCSSAKSCDILVTSAVLGWGLDELQQKLQMLLSMRSSKEQAPESVALKASGS